MQIQKTLSVVSGISIYAHDQILICQGSQETKMQMRRAFRFELCPSGAQARLMSQFAGSCRYVYNRTLATEKSLYGKDKAHRFNYVECANRLVLWKKKHSFLKECHSQVLQKALKDLEKGYKNFFCQESEISKVQKEISARFIPIPAGV